MKIIKNIFLLLIVFLSSCQEDEVLNLRNYPDVKIFISALNSKDASIGNYSATYNEDRELCVDAEVGFKIELAQPTLSDVIVNLSYDLENISDDKVRLPKQIILPVGSAEYIVKLDDLSFMTDLTEQTYGIKVKVASIEGVDGAMQDLSPVSLKINKEAFSTSLQLISSEDTYTFNRIYANGQIINDDKMTFTFKASLTKVLDKDIEVGFTVGNLTEQQQSSFSFSPATITIPAGNLTSDEITCNISDDFLLENSNDENYNITLSANPLVENQFVDVTSNKNQILVNINKSSNILQQIEQGNNWLMIGRDGWIVTNGEGVKGNPQSVVDDRNDTGISLNGGRFAFSAKLPGKANVDFMEINCGQYYYFPREIRISTSEDGSVWKSLGTMQVARLGSYRNSSIFIKFLAPVSSQYFKYEVTGSNSFTNQVTDFKLYIK